MAPADWIAVKHFVSITSVTSVLLSAGAGPTMLLSFLLV
jgi:hypothetical protein